MATTYTANTKIAKPGAGDTGWGPVLTGDLDQIDALAPVGGLFVTTHEQPSSTLLVDISAGKFIDQAGAVQTYAGVSSQAITLSTTKTLYLDGAASWALVVGSAYPATPHVRLATVVAGATTITSVTDNRTTNRIAGQMIPAVTHLISTAASAPTIAAGAAAGSSPTVAVTGTDLAGLISVTTGTTATTGILATISFNVAFGSAPRAIQLTPANANAAAVAAKVFADISSVTTVHFTVDAGVALTDATLYKWGFAVFG